MSTATTTYFTRSLTSDCPSTSNITTTLEEEKSKLNIELFVMYYDTDDIWDRTTTKIDESFICIIAKTLSYKKDNYEPSTIEQVMCRFDWLKWKVAIEEEYASLYKK